MKKKFNRRILKLNNDASGKYGNILGNSQSPQRSVSLITIIFLEEYRDINFVSEVGIWFVHQNE
jgi:hypothetical protein